MFYFYNVKTINIQAPPLHFMVKLSRLLPLEPVVLLLSRVVDQVGDHEGGDHGEER